MVYCSFVKLIPINCDGGKTYEKASLYVCKMKLRIEMEMFPFSKCMHIYKILQFC